MNFRVGVWSGAGYQLELFEVEACHEEEALEKTIVLIEEQKKDYLFFDEVDNLEELESFGEVIYIDATIEGAKKPHYIDATNLRIEKIN